MRRSNLCDFSDTYISLFNSHWHVVIAEVICHIEKKKLLLSALYDTQIPYFDPIIFWLEYLSLVEKNTVKNIHFHDHTQEINAV